MERFKLNIVWPLMLIVLGILFSCSESENNTIKVKNYEKDRDILSHFLEIDTLNLNFYLNMPPTSRHLSDIPEHILREVRSVSEESENRYRAEIDEMNSSIQEELSKTGYLELSTSYDKYFKKVTNSVIEVTTSYEMTNPVIGVTSYDSIPNLRAGKLGKLLTTIAFNDNHAVSRIVYGKDKVITITNLIYRRGGFCEVDISCSDGCIENTTTSTVRIIRAANNSNITSEHIHYWENNREKGNRTRWKFQAIPLSPGIFSNGSLRIYENGAPYPKLPDPKILDVYFVRYNSQTFIAQIINPDPSAKYFWEITGNVDVIHLDNKFCVFHPRSHESAVTFQIYVGKKLMYRRTFSNW